MRRLCIHMRIEVSCVGAVQEVPHMCAAGARRGSLSKTTVVKYSSEKRARVFEVRCSCSHHLVSKCVYTYFEWPRAAEIVKYIGERVKKRLLAHRRRIRIYYNLKKTKEIALTFGTAMSITI